MDCRPRVTASTIVLLAIGTAGCFHSSRALRPERRISYWDALAELHPDEAITAARTPSETEFGEALGNLMSGNLEQAELRFGKLRGVATDSIIRAASRVIYTATLQYQEKWGPLAALKNEPSQSKVDTDDKASIELWAEDFKNVPAKTFTYRSSSTRLSMSVSAVGTPLVPVRIRGKVYNFWLDTGSSLTMLASDVANDLNITPLEQDTLEIVTSTGRVRASPALIPQLEIGQLVVQNAPAMIVEESMMRQMDVEVDYGENSMRLRDPAMSKPDPDRNMFWVGLPVIRLMSTDGVPLHFGLDTGAQLSFVTETLLDKLQLEAARIESRRVGGLGGEVSLRAPVLPDLKVLVRGFPILFRGAVVRAPVYQELASLDWVLGGDIWNSGLVRTDMTTA